MHELILTQNILDLTLKQTAQAGGRRAVRINLLVGPLCDESEESIRFHWDELAKGTLAENAELHFEPDPGAVQCLACGNVFEPAEEKFVCPVCESDRLRLLRGDEVRLESIDVD
jgi:hydrogenase nickel incorporation protein HypA/HybF